MQKCRIALASSRPLSVIEQLAQARYVTTTQAAALPLSSLSTSSTNSLYVLSYSFWSKQASDFDPDGLELALQLRGCLIPKFFCLPIEHMHETLNIVKQQN